jgi:AcrR family transcriptional regulator
MSEHSTAPESSPQSSADRTRAAILAAARDCFCETGYDGTGLRAIAARAGANVALIQRYYGSKEGLFLAAILPRLDIGLLLDGPMDEFGVRVAAIMRMKVERGFDPMVALLRALATPSLAPSLSAALSRQVIAPLAARLDGDEPEMRASLILAHLAGYEMLLRVLQLPELSGAPAAAREMALATTLQDLADGL